MGSRFRPPISLALVILLKFMLQFQYRRVEQSIEWLGIISLNAQILVAGACLVPLFTYPATFQKRPLMIYDMGTVLLTTPRLAAGDTHSPLLRELGFGRETGDSFLVFLWKYA